MALTPNRARAAREAAGTSIFVGSRAFITGPGANEAFGAVLRDIRDTDGAVLFHCGPRTDRG